MKKIFLPLLCLLAWVGCSQSEIEHLSPQPDPLETKTKERLDITVRFSFVRTEGVTPTTYIPPQPTGSNELTTSITIYEQGTFFYSAQAWAQMETATGTALPFNSRIQFTLQDVFVIQNAYSAPLGAADVDIIECSSTAYSGLMPIIQSTSTYVEQESIQLSPASLNTQYDVHWNFEGIPLGSLPPEVDPPAPGARDNRISIEWNGSSWDFVAEKPVASTIVIVGAGPQTSGYEWTMHEGETRISTGNTDPGFSITDVMPRSDSQYDYVFL